MTDQIEEQDVELTEDEEIIEASHGGGHDPKNAEAQSVAATKAAGGATSQAKEPGGAGGKQDPMPKLTKAGMINAMYGAMKKANKKTLGDMYKSVVGEDVEADDTAEVITSNHDEDLNVLIQNEEGLTEGFKEKAAVIFEAAVNTKVNEAVQAKEAEIEAELAKRSEDLEEQYKTDIEEGLQEARDGLVDKIDSYLNYVVETWMEENKLAIEKGLRTEIAETFMNNLKELFKESYIQVPESKVDLVDDLVDQVETLEDEVNKKTEEALAMREAANQMKRTMVIREASKDLAETQKEKLEKLAEGVDFSDEETFAKKIATLKETYFAENAEKAVEAVEAAAEKVDEVTEESGDETSVEVSSVMEKYLTAIRNQS